MQSMNLGVVTANANRVFLLATVVPHIYQALCQTFVQIKSSFVCLCLTVCGTIKFKGSLGQVHLLSCKEMTACSGLFEKCH